MMPTQFPQRKSPRLHGYDYTQEGAYFVTICTHERAYLFGEVCDGEMVLNELGVIAAQEWEQTAYHRVNVEIDAFVIMPNHTHAILVINKPIEIDQSKNRRGLARQTPTSAPQPAFSKPLAGALGTIVGAYKSSVTRQINLVREDRTPIWQRNYHDHIIRNNEELNRIREYIAANPARWGEDVFYAST
jgi:REP element-mobilizing transposase RayT